MSDLVKEAAQSLSPTADLSKQAVNKRKLLALSSRGTSAGGFADDQTSLLGDAFAEVFASMSISNPAPIEGAGSSNDGDSTGEDVVEAAVDSDESGQDDSEQNLADDSGTRTEAAVSAEFVVQTQVSKSDELDNVAEDASVLDAAVEASDETLKIETEDESVEASQLAVASTISQAAGETDLSDQVDRSEAKNNDSDAIVSAVNAETTKPAVRQSDNSGATQAEASDSSGLQTGEQSGEQAGEQSDSESRRRYSNDDRASNEKPAIGASEKSVSETKTPSIAKNQNSGSPLSQSVASAATDQRPAVAPTPASASASAAAATAVNAVSGTSGSALSAASKGASSSSGIANSVSSADGLRSSTVTEQAARPELASNSKSAKKADAGTNQAETLNRIKLVQRVSKAFQHLGPEGGVVRLRLAPVELGTVRVEMQIQQKKVNARVVAETEAASNTLREHLPELRARLEEQGMQIESLEVETQSDDSDSPGLNHRSQNESADQRNASRGRQTRPDRIGRRETGEQERVIAAPVSRQPVSLATSSGVDIRF